MNNQFGAIPPFGLPAKGTTNTDWVIGIGTPTPVIVHDNAGQLQLLKLDGVTYATFGAAMNAGTIDGVVIGGTTPAAGTFSSLSAKIGGFNGFHSHANTADRTWTFPDVTDTVVLLGATQTLTNKTLTTPTIGDFTNANHNHQNAAGGGSLDAAAIGSGTLNNARVNWASPSAIGTGTPAAGTFTTLSTTGKATVRVGTSTSGTSALGGAAFSHFADANNTTTGETDLYTDTTVANTLGTNGDTIHARYSGTTAANANSKTIRIYFGGTLLFSTAAQTFNAFNWTFELWVVRESATIVRTHVMGIWGATAFSNSVRVTGLTLSGTNIVKITGQSGTASSDITAQSGTVDWFSAA